MDAFPIKLDTVSTSRAGGTQRGKRMISLRRLISSAVVASVLAFGSGALGTAVADAAPGAAHPPSAAQASSGSGGSHPKAKIRSFPADLALQGINMAAHVGIPLFTQGLNVGTDIANQGLNLATNFANRLSSAFNIPG
jgi:hypothetical protein